VLASLSFMNYFLSITITNRKSGCNRLFSRNGDMVENGTHVITQWDIHDRGKSSWTSANCFVKMVHCATCTRMANDLYYVTGSCKGPNVYSFVIDYVCDVLPLC